MSGRETEAEYRARMERFNAAKAEAEFYDTGLGRLVPNASELRHAATMRMWDDANAPSRDEYRKRKANG